MGRVTRPRVVWRVGPAGVTRRPDTVAVEEPLEIRLNGDAYLVTMRTPGDDVDLVHGLLHAERLIDGPADVVTARYCDGVGPDGLNTYNVLDVALTAGRAGPDPDQRRSVVVNSACGVCGTTTIDQVLRDRPYALGGGAPVPASRLLAAPDRLRERQRTFARTGGVHAAGLLDAAGELVCVREDVGRHNAVDKVVGWALREGRLPLTGQVLVVSSRASFELTQKAVLAGLAVLVAVSAPSSLAVELADEAGLALVAFARGDTMNVYTHPERLDLEA